MIAKRSARKDKKSSFDALAKYLLDAHKSSERLLYSIFNNCLSDDPELALREIQATQGMNTRAKDNKTYHLIVSFREGDNPTPEQLQAIEQGMADALGLGSHQRLSVLHGDTDHLHLHLAINKIHPETHRMVTPYRDFYHLSTACRRFEQAFGLQIDNGIPDTERISAKARDYEAFQGLSSFQSWAQGEPRQRLQAALERPDTSWQSLHAALGEYNLAIQPRGAGLVIVDRDDSRLRMRASQMSRGFSKAALAARLGPYEPPTGRQHRAGERFEERPGGDGRDARASLWAVYQREREERAKARKAAWTDYRKQREQDFGGVAKAYQQQKQTIRHDRSLRAAQRRAQLSVLRMQRAQAEKALLAQFAEQRKTIQQAHRHETFQAFLERRANEGDALALAALRASGRAAVPGHTPSFGGEPREGMPLFLGFDFQVHRNGDVTYQLGKGHQTLTDTRASLLVGRREDQVNDPTLEIALRVAQMKFGNTLSLNGSEEFQQRAAALAGRLQMRVHFSDEALEAIRKAAQPEVSHVKKDALSAYAKAIGATVIRYGEEGAAQFRGLRQLHDGQKVGVFVANDRTLLAPLTRAQADALSGRPFSAKASGPTDAGRR